MALPPCSSLLFPFLQAHCGIRLELPFQHIYLLTLSIHSECISSENLENHEDRIVHLHSLRFLLPSADCNDMAIYSMMKLHSCHFLLAGEYSSHGNNRYTQLWELGLINSMAYTLGKQLSINTTTVGIVDLTPRILPFTHSYGQWFSWYMFIISICACTCSITYIDHRASYCPISHDSFFFFRHHFLLLFF